MYSYVFFIPAGNLHSSVSVAVVVGIPHSQAVMTELLAVGIPAAGTLVVCLRLATVSSPEE